MQPISSLELAVLSRKEHLTLIIPWIEEVIKL